MPLYNAGTTKRGIFPSVQDVKEKKNTLDYPNAK